MPLQGSCCHRAYMQPLSAPDCISKEACERAYCVSPVLRTHRHAHACLPSATTLTCVLYCRRDRCRGRNVYHAGMARAGYQLGTAAAGEVANTAMESAKGNYLANLVLYPGELLLQHSRQML